MATWIGLAEYLVCYLPVDDRAVVLVELSLFTDSINRDASFSSETGVIAKYFTPIHVRSVHRLGELGCCHIEIQQVRTNTYYWAVFVVKVLDANMVAAGSHRCESPKVCPSY